MKRRRTLLMCWVSLIALAGCAGTGEVIPLQIHPIVTGVRGSRKAESRRSGGGGVDRGRSEP